MTKKIFLLISIFSIIFIANSRDVNAQVYANPEKIEEMKADIDLWLGNQGASAYILWQYSGPIDKYFENDKYSFFQGSPICDALKQKANQYSGQMVGVNIHSLGNKDAATIADTVNYLANDCGVKIIRIFGTPDRGGVAAIRKVLDNAGSIQVIVTIADYANSSEPILPGSIRTDPTTWYAGGYVTTGYRDYAISLASGLSGYGNLYALELANEPHCSGKPGCVNPYIQWISSVSSAIRQNNPGVRIGIGQMASQNTTLGDSPGSGDYGRSNSAGAINISSGHHYGSGEVSVNINARAQTNHEFYIGEAGFEFGEVPSGDGEGKKLKRPLDEGFEPGRYQCTAEVDPQFSVLRPYPANACDPLIPQSKPPATAGELAPDYMRYITYSCGNNLIPEYREDFDPYGVNAQYTGRVLDDGAGGQYVHTYCDQTGPFAEPTEVTCYRSVSMKLDVDLKDANLGILGNSQDPSLDDKQLVNNYLSYYFMGIPQIVDQITDETEEATRKLIEYSGPWRKLAPWELQNIQLRTAIAKEGARTKDPMADNLNIHNYEIADSFWGEDRIAEYDKENRLPPTRQGKELPQYLREQFDWRFGELPVVDFLRSLFGYQTKWARLLQSVPMSSLEDTAGEFVLSIFKPEDGYEYGQQDTAVVGPQGVGNIKTTGAKIVILNAQKAKGPAGTIITPPSTYQPPPPEAISCGEPIKIMPFGDSITAGYGDSPTGYRDALHTKLQQSSLNFDFVGDSQPEIGLDPDHEGHGNTNPTNLALGVGTWINNNPADVVLVHAGTVNLYSQFNPSDPNNLEQAENTPHIKGMRKILETLNGNSNVKKILLATIIKRYDGDDGERSEAYNNVLRKIASDYSKATIVEIENAVTPDKMMSDRVHPTSKGSDDMAEIWKKAILANCR